MKYILCFLVLCMISCKPTSQHSTNTQSAETVAYKDLNVTSFKKGIALSDAVILDVRTPEEIAAGKIKNALELNFYDKDFEQNLVVMDKGKDYYIYCKGGGRSSKTARLMIKNGFEKVNNLQGGYNAWKKDSE